MPVTSSPSDNSTATTNMIVQSVTVGVITTDGAFVYVLTSVGLYKLGTGMKDTVFAYEYATNTSIHAATGTQLICVEHSLYLRRAHSTRVVVINTESLIEVGELLLPVSCINDAFVGDGRHLYTTSLSAAQLTFTQLNPATFSPCGDRPAATFTLNNTSWRVFGASPVAIISSASSDCAALMRTAATVQVGKNYALLLATSGAVFMRGRASVIGLDDVGDVWTAVPSAMLAEPIKFIQIGLDSNNAVLLSTNGRLYIANGMESVHGLSLSASQWPPRAQQTQQPARFRPLTTIPARRHVIAASVNVNSVAYVLDNGRCFMLGRHAMHCHTDTGQVTGLDHVHLCSVALGKTHAVGITRHGHVYTWGLNNMYQCGRVESAVAAAVSPVHPAAPSALRLCPPNDHLWVKDVPTLCSACQQCTAHGAQCPAAGTIGSMAVRQTCAPGDTGCLRCGVCRACGERSATDAPMSEGIQ